MREPMIAARAWGAALVALALLGCGGTPREIRGVVLVTIDTLRADHLGLYGYARPTSPRIDALARESTVFDTAVPTCPATAPSVASIMTGLYRAGHGVRANNGVLPDDVTTLAEILRARGYRTGARVANQLLDARFGFAQGFDDFAFVPILGHLGPQGIVLEPGVLTLLDGLGAPFLLWLHFMEPHGPYRPPDTYRALFRPDDYVWPEDHDLIIARSNYGTKVIPQYQAYNGERRPADYRARYDAAIRYTDDQVGAVIDALRARGLWDDVVLVLTADHGESLGEHDYYFQHGSHAYDDCLHVPLLVRSPGRLPAGRRVAATVSAVDVTPTILELLGMPAETAMEGRSLLPVVRGGESDRPARAQTPYGIGTTALRQGRWKYILTPAPTREELYDLVSDPRELRDLIHERDAEAHEFRRAVADWLREQERRAHGTVAAPGNRELLRSLGYVD